jgi:hypothetical protein
VAVEKPKKVEEGKWFYVDDENRERGPWSDKQMKYALHSLLYSGPLFVFLSIYT